MANLTLISTNESGAGCNLSLNSVITPNEAPPPRRAQNKSAFVRVSVWPFTFVINIATKLNLKHIAAKYSHVF